MNAEDVPPTDIPDGVEPSLEEFDTAAADLHTEPEHVAISAVKAGMLGLALAAGVLASQPAYEQMAAPTPTAVTQVIPKTPNVVQTSPTGPEGDPPDPSRWVRPHFRWTPEGTVSYEFGVAAPSLYANIFGPVAYPAAVTLAPLAPDTIPVPDRFLDRVVTPGTLATAVEQLPDWWTPSNAFGGQVTGHSAQLLEEPVDALLVLQSELQNPSAAPRDAAAARTEAKSYLTELWADLLHKLGDPQTAADKIADELFKLPEHLFLSLGGAILTRLGLKKRGEDDGKGKRPAASESEMAAGYVSVSVFRAGLELRKGILLQTGRALRRINKLFGSALQTDVAQPTPLTQALKNPFWITPATSMNTLSTEAIRSYLNLLAGLYSGAQTEATLAVGFYNRVGGKWQFADLEKPLLDKPVKEK